jgi:hypothetical protein
MQRADGLIPVRAHLHLSEQQRPAARVFKGADQTEQGRQLGRHVGR